jgi:hypothetical protein
MADIRILLTDKTIALLPAPDDGWYLARDTELKGFFVVVGNGKLNLAVKRAELIEQPVQAYHAFSLILDQLAPRTWSKLSSALGLRASGARGRSAAH